MERTLPQGPTKIPSYAARHELRLFGIFSVGKAFLIAMSPIYAVPVALVAIWAHRFIDPCGAAGQKSICGTMQGIELQYHDKTIATPFLLNSNEGGNRLKLVVYRTRGQHLP